MSTGHMESLPLSQCDFSGEQWQFVSDSQDVQAIRDYLGKDANEFDAFFVWIEDGDYVAVWGIEGTVPYLSKRAYLVVGSYPFQDSMPE